jgi:hypothetical protein
MQTMNNGELNKCGKGERAGCALSFFVDDVQLETSIRSAYSVSHRKDGKLGVSVRKNVVFDPKWGLFQDGVLLPESFLVAQDGSQLAQIRKSGGIVCPKPARRVERTLGPILYLGVLHSCWGHLLIDSARFLWPVTAGVLPPDVRFAYALSPAPNGAQTEIARNFVELMKCAGVDLSRLVRVEEPTEFEEILFADEAFLRRNGTLADHYFTAEALELYERIAQTAAPDCAPEPFRKIFLSRSQWTCNARDFGERRIGEVFRDHAGFEIVSPERLTFREMVRLLRETKVLATTEGSIAHNAIFMRDGVQIVLLPKSNHLNPYQVMIDDMRALDVTYVESNWTRFQDCRGMGWLGPFCLVVSRQLARYLNCKPEFCLVTRLRFLAAVLLRRLYLLIRF